MVIETPETAAETPPAGTPSPIPSSTTLADAASEDVEPIDASNSKRNIPDGQEESQMPGQIRDLSVNVNAFLKKLQPLKAVMSTELRKEMEYLATWAEECKELVGEVT